MDKLTILKKLEENIKELGKVLRIPEMPLHQGQKWNFEEDKQLLDEIQIFLIATALNHQRTIDAIRYRLERLFPQKEEQK